MNPDLEIAAFFYPFISIRPPTTTRPFYVVSLFLRISDYPRYLFAFVCIGYEISRIGVFSVSRTLPPPRSVNLNFLLFTHHGISNHNHAP